MGYAQLGSGVLVRRGAIRSTVFSQEPRIRCTRACQAGALDEAGKAALAEIVARLKGEVARIVEGGRHD